MDLETATKIIREARNLVVLTGAGISTDSGIPDFRSPGGIWSKYQPVLFDDFIRSAGARHEYWRQKSEGHRDFADARPNAAHAVLAEWESCGLMRGIITQNIDGLHQLAGNQNVLELHGTAREVSCLGCQFRAPADEYVDAFLVTDEVPSCPRCGGLLKHATISFGQQLSMDVLSEADEWCRDADVIMALGTSLTVSPAADLPRIGVRHGAHLIIINHTETPLDEIAAVLIQDGLAIALREIDHRLKDDQFKSAK